MLQIKTRTATFLYTFEHSGKMLSHDQILKLFSVKSIIQWENFLNKLNLENPNCKSLDLHIIMWFMLKELSLGSTDFTVAIFKISQISKHLSAMLYPWMCSTVLYNRGN